MAPAGVINEEGARIAEKVALRVIIDRASRSSMPRYIGRMHWLGFNTQTHHVGPVRAANSARPALVSDSTSPRRRLLYSPATNFLTEKADATPRPGRRARSETLSIPTEKADQTRVDGERGLRHRRVRHAVRVLDERFHGAQRLGQGEQAGGAGDGESRVLALAQREGNHAAKRRICRAAMSWPGCVASPG